MSGSDLIRKVKEKYDSLPELTIRVFLVTSAAFFLSSIMSTMGGIIDGIIVGHTMSTADVAAMSLTSPVWFLSAFIYAVLNAGAQPRCTQALAAGDQKKAAEIFSMTLIAVTAMTLVLGAALLLASGTAAKLLGAVEGSVEFAPCTTYLRGISFGLPALAAGSVITMSLNLEGQRRWAVRYAMMLTVSNIVLDLLVAVLHGDMLMMGITTSISYWVSFGVYVLYYRRSRDVLLKPVRCKLSLPLISAMALFGLPSGIRRITGMFRSVYLNHLLATSTLHGVAAYNVQVQFSNLIKNVYTAIGLTMAMMLGFYFHEENKDGVRYTVVIALILELIFGLIFTRMLTTNEIAHSISWFYLGKDMDSRWIADIAIGFYGYGLIGQALAVLFAVYLQTIGRTLLSNAVYFLSDIALVYYYIQPKVNAIVPSMGATRRTAIIFYYLSVSQLRMLIVIPVIIIVVNFLWKNRSDKFTDMMLMLPKGYGNLEGNELVASPKNMQQVTEFSEKAYDFCLSHGGKEREAYVISLAAEEMAGNIIKHGFKDKGRHTMELRLIRKDNSFLLRIRDDSHIFDPIKKMASVSDIGDPTRYIGIRLIMKMASEVTYTSTLKLNNLVVRVDIPDEQRKPETMDTNQGTKQPITE